MIENVFYNICGRNEINVSLCLYYCGSEVCKPGQTWGPCVVDHFLIYYILDGRGSLKVNNVTYNLKKGQGFLISPNVISSFKADSDSPWTYSWFGFYGYKADVYLSRANLTADNPVFTYDRDDFFKDSLDMMLNAAKLEHNRYCKLMSILYLLLSELIDIANDKQVSHNKTDMKEFYVRKTLDFISMNYYRKVKIEDIAQYIGINRKYLCSVFKSNLKVSPQEYLINYRITKACELIANSPLSIADISRSVGYLDSLLFSKIFKKITGESPQNYRKRITL